MVKNNRINFLGLKKGPKFMGGKSSVNFLISKKYKIKKRDMNLNWKQAKRKYPKLKPFVDNDMDGSVNILDCKPLNPGKDGIMSFLKEKFGRKDKPSRTISVEEMRRRQGVRREAIIVREAKRKYKKEQSRRRIEKFKKLVEKPSETGGGFRKLTKKLLVKKVPYKTKGGKIAYRYEARKGKAVIETVKGISQLAGIPERFPSKKKGKKGGKTYAGRGRPKGSYKYSIPGRGKVSVFEYKKWLTQQRALARVKALQHIKALEAGQAQALPDEQVLEGYKEMGEEEYEEAPTQQPVQRRVVQRPTPEQIRQYQMAQQRYRQSQQYQQQVRRPSQVAGGPTGTNILQAPNVFKGEMVNQVRDIPSVQMGERPQTNPQGEMYSQIDPMSGRQILHRRISEKFATGEAL